MSLTTPQPTPFAPEKESKHWYHWLLRQQQSYAQPNDEIIVIRGTALPIYPYRTCP